MHMIRDNGVSDELMSDVLARDCVLWLTTTTFSSAIGLERLVEITGGPWRGVFVESTAADFGSALAARNQSIDSADATGAFTHLIAADPLSLQLQRRAKPVFFLNGRADRDGTESASIPTRSAVRRRLNMTAKLRELEPRRVVVVGERPDAAIQEIAALWDIDFRSLLTIVTDDESFPQRAETQLQGIDGLNVIHWISKPPIEFAASLLGRSPDSSA